MLNEECQPVAYQCDSYEDFIHGHCSSCGLNGEKCILPIYIPETMAEQMIQVPRNAKKSYFVMTRDRNPLCSKQNKH
jgi:hypothetical protein